MKFLPVVLLLLSCLGCDLFAPQENKPQLPGGFSPLGDTSRLLLVQQDQYTAISAFDLDQGKFIKHFYFPGFKLWDMEEMGGELYLLLQSPYEFVFARYTPSNGQLTPLPLPHGMKGMDSLSTHGDHIYISAFNSQEYRILEYDSVSETFTSSWPSQGYSLTDTVGSWEGKLNFPVWDGENILQLYNATDGENLDLSSFRPVYDGFGLFILENDVFSILGKIGQNTFITDLYRVNSISPFKATYLSRQEDVITEGHVFGDHFFAFGNPRNELRPPEEAKNGMVIQRFNPETMEKTGEAVVSGSNMVGINFFKDNYLWIPMGSNSVPGLVRIDPDTLEQKVFESPELPYGK